MPTVECDRRDCEHHGIDICIARRVLWSAGQCSKYRPRRGGQNLLDAPFRANCRKEHGRYKSPRVTAVLK